MPHLSGAPPCPLGGDLSRPALVKTMARGGAEAWVTVTSFCKAVMLAKGDVGSEREGLQSSVSRSHHRLIGRPNGRSSATVGAGLRTESSG